MMLNFFPVLSLITTDTRSFGPVPASDVIVAGFLLGGTFGAGTLVCMTLVGPVAGFFLPVNEKLVNALLKRAGSAV